MIIMEQNSVYSKISLSRRSFLFLGVGTGGALVISSVIGPKEETIWKGIYFGWTEGWTPTQAHPIKAIDSVLSVIREDKLNDLELALKLLSISPLCYFLTGYFSPWNDLSKVQNVLKRWSQTESSLEKTLYGAFSAIINSAFYGDPLSWAEINYPGPPEFSLNEGAK